MKDRTEIQSSVEWEDVVLSQEKRRLLPSRRELAGEQEWDDAQFEFFRKRQALVEKKLRKMGIIFDPVPIYTNTKPGPIYPKPPGWKPKKPAPEE